MNAVLKSVCREVHCVALAARIERMYRLRMNRRVQAYRRYQDLERIHARFRWLNTFQNPIKPAHLAKAVTEKT
jgi:hypothetical protein